MLLIARGFAYIFVLQIVIAQVSAHQQPITQYLLPNYGQVANPVGYPPRPIQPSLPNLATVAPVASTLPLSKPPSAPKPEPNGPLDSTVLNNLAIALQLLILCNIMNMPAGPERLSKFESLSVPNLAKFESKNEFATPIVSYLQPTSSYVEQALPKPNMYSYEAPALPKPNVYSYEAQSLPNANFLGSSGFGEPSFGPTLGTTKPNPRSSMTLMSPYDALGTSSFADPWSSFPSSYSKKDFQSPYASIVAADGARDLFSMADLF